MHHPTDRITHTTAFVTPVVEHWLEREIAQWVHHEGSIRRPIVPSANALTTELHLAPSLHPPANQQELMQALQRDIIRLLSSMRRRVFINSICYWTPVILHVLYVVLGVERMIFIPHVTFAYSDVNIGCSMLSFLGLLRCHIDRFQYILLHANIFCCFLTRAI